MFKITIGTYKIFPKITYFTPYKTNQKLNSKEETTINAWQIFEEPQSNLGMSYEYNQDP